MHNHRAIELLREQRFFIASKIIPGLNRVSFFFKQLDGLTL